jgi:hypothetical protein
MNQIAARRDAQATGLHLRRRQIDVTHRSQRHEPAALQRAECVSRSKIIAFLCI